MGESGLMHREWGGTASPLLPFSQEGAHYSQNCHLRHLHPLPSMQWEAGEGPPGASACLHTACTTPSHQPASTALPHTPPALGGFAFSETPTSHLPYLPIHTFTCPCTLPGPYLHLPPLPSTSSRPPEVVTHQQHDQVPWGVGPCPPGRCWHLGPGTGLGRMLLAWAQTSAAHHWPAAVPLPATAYHPHLCT